MKKLYSLLLLATALTANAQQLPNIGFDGWKTCEAYYGNGKYREVGVDPEGWNGANVYQVATFPQLVTKGEEENGNTFALLKNYACGAAGVTAVAPGYLSLGTPWSYAKTSGSFILGTLKIAEADGGTFGGMDFKYRPDAITFKYKSARNNTNEPISVIAYTWKGEFSGTESVGYNGKSETMIDRDSYVLGLNTKCTKSNDAKLLASINTTINGEATDWTEKTIEFNYVDKESTPEKLNVIFCAGNYFGERSDLKENNTLSIDDVSLVYYHALQDVKYNRTTIKNFSENTYSYDLSDVYYDESKLAVKEKGVGATVEKNFDNETCVLTINVKGNDYSKNRKSISTYTIQFKKPVYVTTSYGNSLLVDAKSDGVQFTKESTIKVEYCEEFDKYNFLLENFSFGPLSVGDILVEDIPHATSNGVVTLHAENQNVNLPGLGGELPLNVDATIDGENMIATIVIPFGADNIDVTFAPALTINPSSSLEVSNAPGLTNVVMNRTFAAGWNTYCMPFDYNLSSLNAEAKAQEFVSSNGNSLTFEAVNDGVLKANVPYLVYFPVETTVGTTEAPRYFVTNVASYQPTSVEHSGFTFVGNYEASKSMDGLYGVASEGDVQKIMLGTAGSTLPATCAYFTAPTGLNANGLRICFDGGEVTGINQVNGAQAQSAGAVYNLQGIKVSNRGTNNLPAGLYIMQGKKVIVK